MLHRHRHTSGASSLCVFWSHATAGVVAVSFVEEEVFCTTALRLWGLALVRRWGQHRYRRWRDLGCSCHTLEERAYAGEVWHP